MSPNSNLLDCKVSELIHFKNLVDEYYGEGVFHKAMEDDLSSLFAKGIVNQKMKVLERGEKAKLIGEA